MPKTSPPHVPAGFLASMVQPVIEAGEGLKIRPWGVADAGPLIEAYQDPDIRYWHNRSFVDVDEAVAYILGGRALRCSSGSRPSGS